MHIISSFLKKYWIPIIAILIFLILCIYNLPNQYLFNGDSARDTLASLRILNTKDITIIGPPLSLGLNGMRETYFSSLIYYVTAFMLAITNNSIIATVIAITLINASGIIPLFLILKERKLTSEEILLLLLVYVTNPEVVLYSRILWNPSPQIGLGLWALYFLRKSAIIFGLIAGLALYFHYFAITLIIFGCIYYLKEKKYKDLFYSLGAFIGILMPFIIFELKNKFYLTLSFIYNLQSAPSGTLTDSKYKMFLEIPTHTLGLMNDPFTTKLINVAGISLLLGGILWLVLIAINRKNIYFVFFLLASIVTALSSSIYVRTQYLFIAIGVLIAYCINAKTKVAKGIIIFIIVLQSVNTIYIINQRSRIQDKYPFPLITELETVNNTIKKLHKPDTTFNITENITGDARALYLRFFLERDKVLGLQNELQYEGLQELYVLTPSIEKTLKESRWEFTATKNLVKTDEIKVGEFFLLRYEQKTAK